MEEVNNEKISFFKRVLISVKDFEKYKLFATEKVRKSIKYIFQLVLLFVIAIAVVFTIKYSVLINNTLNYIKNDLPNFTYNNGNLNFEEENLLEFQSNESSKNDISYKIIIDTKTENQEEIEDYKKKIGLYNYGILFLKDKIIITNSLESTQAITEKSYKELESSYGIDSSFNKEDLVNYINNTNINVLYEENKVCIYTNKVPLQKQLNKLIGNPTKEYKIKRSIVGSEWDIPINDKSKISKIILKANIYEL